MGPEVTDDWWDGDTDSYNSTGADYEPFTLEELNDWIDKVGLIPNETFMIVPGLGAVNVTRDGKVRPLEPVSPEGLKTFREWIGKLERKDDG
jgi:hypothetical protein